MNKIDKRTLPKKANTIKQISKTKRENSRKEIVEKISKNTSKQSNKQLAVCSHRKLNHISFEEYKKLISQGKTVKEIIQTTSKHLVYFYNAMLKGKINLSKEDFETMYNNGMSLDEISKESGKSKIIEE